MGCWRGGVGTTHGAPVFVCRMVVGGGGGVRTTHGAPVFVCRNKKKQRNGFADWLLQGGGAEQHTGPQSLFVEKGRNKEEGWGPSDCLFLVVVVVVVVVGAVAAVAMVVVFFGAHRSSAPADAAAAAYIVVAGVKLGMALPSFPAIKTMISIESCFFHTCFAQVDSEPKRSKKFVRSVDQLLRHTWVATVSHACSSLRSMAVCTGVRATIVICPMRRTAAHDPESRPVTRSRIVFSNSL